MIQEVELHSRANKLLETYKTLFKQKFDELPVIDTEPALDTLKWLLNQMGMEKAIVILNGYLRLEDEWVKARAYPLSWLKNNVNQVIVSCAKAGKLDIPKYVVGITSNGFPVLSINPNELKGSFSFKPILFEDWKKCRAIEKLQHPHKTWESLGNNVGEWYLNWENWGFL